MKNICIIPARGGSKRIPKKNIKNFLGVPIIKYSIEAAFNTKLFKDVIVSTDNEEISKLSSEFGASVPFTRPKRISNDFLSRLDTYLKYVYALNPKDIQKLSDID